MVREWGDRTLHRSADTRGGDRLSGVDTSDRTGGAEPAVPYTTRDRILRAALDLFADHGYQRTSLQQIANRLKLTKAAILYHFPSKDQLVVALLEPFLADLEAALRLADGHPSPTARWVLLEAWVDAMIAHRHSLGMLLHDASMLTRSGGGTYARIMSIARRAYAIVAGPDATLHEQVRAVQAVAALGDPVVFFDDVPAPRLRAEMLAGVRRLLGDSTIEPRPADAPAAEAAQRPADAPAAGGRRRAGRPPAMSPERTRAAQAMYAQGGQRVEEIAALLGVSRATVYRHLRPPESSQNAQ